MQLVSFFAHLFVPHHKNNHKARVIHPVGITVIALFFASFQLFLHVFPKVDGQVLGYAANISVEDVIALTNQKRAEAGLSPLKHNSTLSLGAHAKGLDMLAHDYWAHVSPDGTTPWKFFNDVSYKYKYAGENLARDFSNASAAVNAWMASPTHKENMLSAKYKEIGIGVVEGDLGGVDTTIVVQFFGTTLADAVPPTNIATAPTPRPSLAPVATPRPQIAAVVTPTPLPSATPSVTLASSNQVLISPFVTTRGLSLGIIGVLLAAFILDIVVISRRRLTRISGRSIAHVAFLGMILTIAIIVEAGRIL